MLQDIQTSSEKSEKRLSTKDELTGQESEDDKLSEQIDGVEEGTERDMDQEELFREFQFDGDEDSDHDLQIFNV